MMKEFLFSFQNKKISLFEDDDFSVYVKTKDASLLLSSDSFFDGLKKSSYCQRKKDYISLDEILDIILEEHILFIKRPLFTFLKENSLLKNVEPYLLDWIESVLKEEKDGDDEEIDLDPYLSLFQTFDGKEDEEKEESSFSILYMREQFEQLLDSLKERYCLPFDYKKEIDKEKLDSILDGFLNKDFGHYDLVEEYSLLLYELIKKKPFLYHNELLSSLLFLDCTKHLGFLKEFSASDLSYCIGLIEASEDKTQTMRRLKDFFSKTSCDLPYVSLKRKRDDLISCFFEEKAFDYLFDFLNERHYSAGFYDYFQANGGIYKLHYKGIFSSFSLNPMETIRKEKSLVLNCRAVALLEVPSEFQNRKKMISSFYKKVKEDSFARVKKEILSDIRKEMDSLLDLEGISIEFVLSWSVKIEKDYDF